MNNDVRKLDVAERRLPGIEIIEHPYEVPDESMGILINVRIESETLRNTSVTVVRNPNHFTDEWDRFIELTQDL